MRLNTNPVKLSVAALFAGGLAVAAVAHAAPPAPRQLDVENDVQYVEHLRSERRSLTEVRDMLNKEDISDRANHRHEALDHLDKAIEALNSEISSYDKDMKHGK